MKKLFTFFALALLAFVVKPERSVASHIAGADLTYLYNTPISGVPNQWLVKLQLYRDCQGITVGTQEFICYSSLSSGQSGSVAAPQVGFLVVPNTACVTAPAFCPGGVGDVELYVYEALITLPSNETDWVFSWNQCCRNAAITNLVNGGGQDLFISAHLDNVTAPTNSSPQFLTLAYTRFCVGNPFYYDQGASDPDGDSLVFSLVDAEGGFGCPGNPTTIQYTPGFSATSPVSSSIPVTIDQNTGIINFIPTAIQVDVICVLVREYRNGVLIGQVKRDIQILIVAGCLPIFPSFNDNIIAPTGFITANCNEYTVTIPFDTAFQCGSVVPTDLRTISPFGMPNPIVAVNALNCTNGESTDLEITFLNPLSHGITKVWVKPGLDGNSLLSECGTGMSSQDTVQILVDDQSTWTAAIDTVGCVFNDFTVTLTDSIYCFSVVNDGTDLQLTDQTGANFPISNAYGYCTPGGLKANQLLVEMAQNTSGTGYMYLTVGSTSSDFNTIANNCGKFLNVGDTLAVLYVDNFIPVNLGSDQNICDDQPLPVLNTGYPGLTHVWSDQNGVISGATDTTLSITASGTYSVFVSSSPTCEGGDTVVITIEPAPDDMLGPDIVQCQNDPLPTFDAGNPGATYQWFINGNLIPGETNQTYVPGYGTGVYSVQVDIGTVCDGLYELDFTLLQPAQVNLLDASICNGAPLPLLDAGNPGSTYQWFLNSNPIAGATDQTYQTTQAGNYSVVVGSGSCEGTGDMDLVIVDNPVVTLTNIDQCITAPFQALDAGNPGASYQWYENGNPIPGATSQTYTPSQAGTYSVDVTVPPGCSASGSMVLNIVSAPVIAISDTTICQDGQAVLDAGNSGATFQWSNGSSSQSISVNQSGTYYVTVNLSGCEGVDSATVAVDNYPAAPVVNCNTGLDPNFKFVYTWNAVPGAVSYEISEDNGATWVPANGITGVETHGTNNTVPFFLVRAVSNGLCRTGDASDPIACQVIVPNIITPNGDGKNEYLKLENIEQYPNNTMQIFNRWGKEVFSAGPYNNTSNRFEGKDLPDGVYFYILNLGDGQTEGKSGTVTINR